MHVQVCHTVLIVECMLGQSEESCACPLISTHTRTVYVYINVQRSFYVSHRLRSVMQFC